MHADEPPPRKRGRPPSGVTSTVLCIRLKPRTLAALDRLIERDGRKIPRTSMARAALLQFLREGGFYV